MDAPYFNAPESTRIQDMPSELLYKIFRRVEVKHKDDLDNLQQVCNLWYCIIDQRIGRTVSTSTKKVVHPSNPNLSKVGLDLISEIGVNYLHIKQRHGYLPEEPPLPLPSFKLPYLLKHLRLHGRIHPDLFKNLVRKTTNLAVFDVSMAILCHLRNTDLKHLDFPRLTKLRVTYYWVEWGEENESEFLSLPNLQAFLEENVFPWLTRLRVDFPFSGVEGLETIKALTRFIQNHPRLEKLFVRMKFPEISTFVPEDPVAYQKEVDAIISRVRSSDCRSLKSFRVGGQFMARTHSHFEILNELALRQTLLQSLDLRIDNSFTYNALNAICTRCGSTLLKLRINGVLDDMDWTQFDCTVFSPLRVIRSLEVRYGWRPLANAPRYLDLPPTLKYLSLAGNLRSDEVAQIILELPNLRYIRLSRCIGEENDDQVNVGILQQFAQNRRVKVLILLGFRMSEEFLHAGISNGDPINPQRLTIWFRSLRQHNTGSINWKLSQSGYYENSWDED